MNFKIRAGIVRIDAINGEKVDTELDRLNIVITENVFIDGTNGEEKSQDWF